MWRDPQWFVNKHSAVSLDSSPSDSFDAAPTSHTVFSSEYIPGSLFTASFHSVSFTRIDSLDPQASPTPSFRGQSSNGGGSSDSYSSSSSSSLPSLSLMIRKDILESADNLPAIKYVTSVAIKIIEVVNVRFGSKRFCPAAPHQSFVKYRKPKVIGPHVSS